MYARAKRLMCLLAKLEVSDLIRTQIGQMANQKSGRIRVYHHDATLLSKMSAMNVFLNGFGVFVVLATISLKF